MGKYFYTLKDGYNYISDTGVVYDLYEGKSLFGETTSDMTIMFFSDSEEKLYGPKYIGFVYGATMMTNKRYRDDVLKSFDRLANNYEKEHPEVVKYYGEQSMMEEIKKTVETYLIIGREVLNDYEIEKLEKQIEFLDKKGDK